MARTTSRRGVGSIAANSAGRLAARLDEAWDRALAPWRSSSETLGILFSGGVDSALLAWELRRRKGVELSTAGLDGSPDLRAARSGAELLGLPWSPAVVSASEVVSRAEELREDLEGLSPVGRRVLVSFAVAVAHANPSELLCGQGADELFLGYAHYRGLSPASALLRAEEDLERLRENEWPRAQNLARRLGKSVHAPYLEPEFIAAARAVPVEIRLPREVPKAFFRDWALRRGLPSELAGRPKRALQYGSGFDRVLRRSL
jgi:asparagine synthase (glutamine-hydrolysing)